MPPDLDTETTGNAEDSFTVVLQRSGMTLIVPAGRSIAETAEAAGMNVATSCREGTCGTCETAVLDGIPDHRDSFLQPEERADNATMMICCSRALTDRIVLDV
jgi:ferredoxin